MADPFVTEIRIFPFNFAPKGRVRCDGQLLPLSRTCGRARTTPAASFDVMVADGEPSDDYVHRGERDVRIADIALLRERRR